MLTFSSYLDSEIELINAEIQRSIRNLPPYLYDIAAYTALSGGKRIRPILTLASARLFGIQGQELYGLSVIPELIHVATLLHDDVLDHAKMRRGRPAAHIIFGAAPAILAGDALLALANHMAASYGSSRIMQCVSEAVIMTAEGEAHEMKRQHCAYCDNREYVDIVTGKTGWLIRCACRLGTLYAGAADKDVERLSEFGLNLGIAFQLIDDALDFADENETGKPTAGDLQEGKFTPPLMMYADSLQNHHADEFLNKFKHGSFTQEELKAIAGEIRKKGFDEATRALAGEYLGKAASCLEGMPSCFERNVFFDALEYVRARKK